MATNHNNAAESIVNNQQTPSSSSSSTKPKSAAHRRPHPNNPNNVGTNRRTPPNKPYPLVSPSSTTAGVSSTTTPSARNKPKTNNSTNRPTNGTSTPNHSLTKRPTAKLSQRPNDIYVSNKSDFRAQLKQCTTLLSCSDFHEVFLHSIGNAITRAINLALTLVRESHGGLGYEANTSTITLTDNLHPLHDDADFAVRQRLNGCLHVRVYRHCRDVLLEEEDVPKEVIESASAEI